MPKRLPYLIRPCIFIKLISNVMNIITMSIGDLGSVTDVRINNLLLGNGTTKLNQYTEFTTNPLATGTFTPGIPTTLHVVRIGDIVTVSVQILESTSQSNSPIIIASGLPAPKFLFNNQIWVTSNNIKTAGNCVISGTGDIVIFNGFGGTFSQSVTNGFPGFTFSYVAL
jgi:hypothetical protein